MKFPLEQIEQMDRFLERLIEAGTMDINRQVSGVARDYAEEIVDLLVDAKVDLGMARLVVEARAAREAGGGDSPAVDKQG